MSKLSELLRECIRDPEELRERLGMGPGEAAWVSQVAERYPVCVTPYYLSLIDPSDPEDPIRKLCIPSRAEASGEGHEDTSGEQSNTVLTGVQHKYARTVLVLTTSQCAMYCRHCFRKRMVGYTSDEVSRQISGLAEYVKNHPEVNNVLLSGGDAFVNENHVIEAYLEALAGIGTLGFIRFGTRTPVVLPERITGDPELLGILRRYGLRKQLIVVTHFDHPKELTPEAHSAVRALRGAGCVVRNQTVLLRGINDDPDVLAALQNGLVSFGVEPYYVFQCRPARGVMTQFQVPLREGYRIVEAAKAACSGQSKAFRYVLSHVTGKIEILGPVGGKMLFKYHQAKDPADNGRIFAADPGPDRCWLDGIPGPEEAPASGGI